MTYQIWGIFAGRRARVFKGLTANEAAHWIVRFRQIERFGYWMESDD